eukprot:snap_masked-scaffold_1-processed-gene-13.17-mRNA-1 protein AED:1.00 eAED:1.00 QI:0/0/0/0/1/1/3/0/95
MNLSYILIVYRGLSCPLCTIILFKFNASNAAKGEYFLLQLDFNVNALVFCNIVRLALSAVPFNQGVLFGKNLRTIPYFEQKLDIVDKLSTLPIKL